MSLYKRPILIDDLPEHTLRRRMVDAARDSLPGETPEELVDRLLSTVGAELGDYDPQTTLAVVEQPTECQAFLDEILVAMGDPSGGAFTTDRQLALEEAGALLKIWGSCSLHMKLSQEDGPAESALDVEAQFTCAQALWVQVDKVLRAVGVVVPDRCPFPWEDDPKARLIVLKHELDGWLATHTQASEEDAP